MSLSEPARALHSSPVALLSSSLSRLSYDPTPISRLPHSAEIMAIKDMLSLLQGGCVLCWMNGAASFPTHLYKDCPIFNAQDFEDWMKGLPKPRGFCHACGCPSHVSVERVCL